MKTAILKSTRKHLAAACCLASLALLATAVSAQNLDKLYFSPTPLAAPALKGEPLSSRRESAATQLDAGASAADSTLLHSSRERFLGNVLETEQTEGPWSAGLAQQYLSLGNLFQLEGNTEKALEYYSKAEHNSRVNFGLYSPQQFIPIKRSIDVYLSLNDYEQALERQEYLVYLHKAHFGREALEVAPELAALGDMYFEAYERTLHYQNVANEVALDFGPDTQYRSPEEMTTLEKSFQFLNLAQKRYIDSIKTLISQKAWHDPLLVPLENNLVATYFLQANRSRLAIDAQFFMSARDTGARDTARLDQRADMMPMYREGMEAFNRMLAYQQNSQETRPEEIAETMLKIGDWHRLFGYTKRARKQYESARRYLVNSTCDPEVRASLLAPQIPVQLPTFIARPNLLTNRHEPAADISFSGYIDIAFTLDETGNAENIEIMDKSANTSGDVERRLLKVLRDAPFRPALAEADQPDKFELRYHFAML